MGLTADNRYLFTLDGKRQKINLSPQLAGRALTRVVGHIENLVRARKDNRPADTVDETWAQNLGDDRLRRRLGDLGVIQRRERMTLREWLYQMETDRRDLSDGAFAKIKQSVSWLRKALANALHLDLHRIGDDHAVAFKLAAEKRMAKGTSRATIRTHYGNVRTMFNLAIARRLSTINPFNRKDMAVGSTARPDPVYVPWETVECVCAQLARPADRCLLALARLLGVRVPSEPLLICRDDIDREKRRVLIHDGKRRVVREPPLDDRLLPYLDALLADIETDQSRLFLTGVGGAMDRRIAKAAKAAGVPMWPDRFQTLRASCEMEWRDLYDVPDSLIEKWIGHRPEVARKHYNQRVAEEAYAKYPIGPNRARNRAQQAPDSVGMGQQAAGTLFAEDLKSLGFSDTNRCVPIRAGIIQVEAGGIEPPS